LLNWGKNKKMKIQTRRIEIKSTSQIEFIDITDQVQEIIENSGVREGQVLVYSPHTSASIIINHNEKMLLQDFMRILYRLVPIGDRYSHDIFEITLAKSSDGRSNGHSHCKAMLLGTSEVIPIEKGKMMITHLQSIFLVELDGGRTRDIIIQVIGI